MLARNYLAFSGEENGGKGHQYGREMSISLDICWKSYDYENVLNITHLELGEKWWIVEIIRMSTAHRWSINPWKWMKVTRKTLLGQKRRNLGLRLKYFALPTKILCYSPFICIVAPVPVSDQLPSSIDSSLHNVLDSYLSFATSQF